MIESIVAELEEILARMDELGLNLPAAHVSQGIDACRHLTNQAVNGAPLGEQAQSVQTEPYRKCDGT